MVFYGKLKDGDSYGFGVFKDRFDSYVEVEDGVHMSLIEKANNENKEIIPDDKGYPTLTDRTPPSQEEVARMRINELENYLRETDWYAIRFADTGEVIPSEIKNNRQDARDEISRLRAEYPEPNN